MHDSIKPPVWSRRLSPNLSETSLAGCAAVLFFASLTLGPFGIAMRALTAHPPNWIQANLTTRRWTKPAGLIESCTQGSGDLPQIPCRRADWGREPQRRPGGRAPRATFLRRSRPGVWCGARTPCVHDSIKPPVRSPPSSPNLSESSLAGGL